MLKEVRVNLGNLFLSLSDAVDLASPSIASHQLRTAYIAWQMACGADLSQDAISNIFLGALLHDVGALTPEEKLRLHNFDEANPETHCIIGESLLKLSPLVEPASHMVRFHHRPWQDWDTSLGSRHVLESQILLLSDLVERSVDRDVYVLHQVDRIVSKIKSLSRTDVHPDVVDIFVTLSRREEFWLDLVSPRLYSLLLHFGPFRGSEITLEPIYKSIRSPCFFVASLTLGQTSLPPTQVESQSVQQRYPACLA